jgi:hypothetical protein
MHCLLIPPILRLTADKRDAQVDIMTLHLVKLCVGCDSVDDLSGWIAERKADRIRRGVSTDRVHRTRQSPKRADELLDGGSLYWVIKGEIKVRETILDLRSVTDDAGISHCDIVLTGELVPVEPRRLRPFQGWRYLAAHEAPRDLASFGSGMRALPPELARELAVLGLL